MLYYEIGGSVRDFLLGIDSKDKDFVCVTSKATVKEAWEEMKTSLIAEGFEIFLETEDCYTIRAKFPKEHKHRGLVADFVLARKENGYKPGTRKPILTPGTIVDDVYRRDFTINTLYKTFGGEIVDLTGRGIEDIKYHLIDTPTDPNITFVDDPLRIFRAIRFAITKHFILSDRVIDAIQDNKFDFDVISIERVRDELEKCFKANVISTLKYLERFPILKEYAFENGKLWLLPTLKQK